MACKTELSHSSQRIMSERRPEKKNLPEKSHSREKTQREIWVGSMDHALKSPSYEGYTTGRLQPTITKHVFQQNKVNSK